MKNRILVVDDDREIVRAIQIYLEKEGYEVLKAYDGTEAIDIVEKEDVHLILLDIMMPKLDGIQSMNLIRQNKSIPIIIISAKSEDADKIVGLEEGADDYITKPFNPAELLARVKSQLRRYTQYQNLTTDDEDNHHIFQQGSLVMDDEKKKVTVDGEEAILTPIEYNILKLLLKNPGKVFSSEEIYEQVWQEDSIGSVQTVAVHIRHIREKIEINPKEPRYLIVVWGLGYKIEVQREQYGNTNERTKNREDEIE